MMGNGLGLLGPPEVARRRLTALARSCEPGAKIVGSTVDPAKCGSRHLAYQIGRSQVRGDVRIRVRYKRYRSPWMRFMFFSPRDLEAAIDRTPWSLMKLIPGEDGGYSAVLVSE